MIVNIFNEQADLRFATDQLPELVAAVVAEEGQTCDEVSIYFIDTEEMCALHKEFFDDPSPTDCISFPMDEDEGPYRLLGDLFVCPETALNYSKEHQTDTYEELTLYIVHGLLHLMGYRDIDEADIQHMREAERKQMAQLKRKNLIIKELN